MPVSSAGSAGLANNVATQLINAALDMIQSLMRTCGPTNITSRIGQMVGNDCSTRYGSTNNPLKLGRRFLQSCSGMPLSPAIHLDDVSTSEVGSEEFLSIFANSLSHEFGLTPCRSGASRDPYPSRRKLALYHRDQSINGRRPSGSDRWKSRISGRGHIHPCSKKCLQEPPAIPPSKRPSSTHSR